MQREAAEDLVQEVMLVLHEKYAALDRVEDLLPLSLEIARFKIVAARRKMVRRNEHTQVSIDDLPIAGSMADPFAQAARRERIERLESILKSLGGRCREIIALKLQGRTFSEIQKIMKASSLNTVYSWDFRCREEIRARWSETGDFS